MVPWTCFEMWRPCFPHGVHHYRIVLRGKSYDAEKNGKIISQFAELKPAQRCIEASAQRAEAWRARRMARVMAKTRAALAEEIRRDVPFERLFAAMSRLNGCSPRCFLCCSGGTSGRETGSFWS